MVCNPRGSISGSRRGGRTYNVAKRIPSSKSSAPPRNFCEIVLAGWNSTTNTHFWEKLSLVLYAMYFDVGKYLTFSNCVAHSSDFACLGREVEIWVWRVWPLTSRDRYTATSYTLRPYSQIVCCTPGSLVVKFGSRFVFETHVMAFNVNEFQFVNFIGQNTMTVPHLRRGTVVVSLSPHAKRLMLR